MNTLERILIVTALAALAGCAGGKGKGNNNTPDAQADAGGEPPVLYSVAPHEGPLDGGTQVELSGLDFAEGMEITFGGRAATEVTVLSGSRALCVTPAGESVGQVTVRVENPDGQFSQLAGAFNYHDAQAVNITWCQLHRPQSVTTLTQVATPLIYGWVYAEGVTDLSGRGPGVNGQVGYGPVGSDPDASALWTWVSAVFAGDASAIYDEYVASLTLPTAGTYDVAYRFSGGTGWLYCDRDSSENGYQPEQAMPLTVTAGTDPMPDWCSLIAPLTLSATVGVATGPVTGQVFAAGVTEGAGHGESIEAELGFGPPGTHPGLDPGWQFTAGAYLGDVGNNDEYSASLTASGPGSFDYAWRFRLGTGPWLYCDGNGSDDGYSASYAGDLTVTGQSTQAVDWCNLQHPPATTAEEGSPTELIFGRVFVQGITSGHGQGMGVQAEVGYGEVGSDPATHGSWQWTPATYNLSVDGLISGDLANDEYMATFTVPTAGAYDYAYRFSADGGTTWLHCDLDGAEAPSEYSPAQAGALTVTPVTTSLTLTAVDRPRGSILGGTQVTITGTGFTASTTVAFDGVASSAVTYVGSFELLAVTPPGSALGEVDVVVTNPGPTSATLPGGFEYLLIFSPSINGDLSDWPLPLRVAQNTVATDWGAGENELGTLYVAFDQTSLYLGIEGTVQSGNAILAVIDLDFGASTGVGDFSTLTDTTGALDVIISGTLNVTASGFGAEAVMGTKDMASVSGGTADSAGWRGLTPANDLPWLTGTLATGPSAVEGSIALSTLFPGGVPASGATLAVVVKIGDYQGSAWATQALPEQAGTSTVTQVFSFRIFPASGI